jgi:anti-anti-sigma regulatory factor
MVEAHTHRGERRVVLDLTRVPTIDAAGIGELVRAHTAVSNAHGVLQIANPTRWVREMLERVGLFELLSYAPPASGARLRRPSERQGAGVTAPNRLSGALEVSLGGRS